MSTVYTLECSAGGISAGLEITVTSPMSDNWSALQPRAWGLDGGPVANWGTGEVILHGPGGSQIATLDLKKTTRPQESGNGKKYGDDGQLPSGPFTWTCLSVI